MLPPTTLMITLMKYFLYLSTGNTIISVPLLTTFLPCESLKEGYLLFIYPSILYIKLWSNKPKGHIQEII